MYAASPPVLHGAVSCDDIMTNGSEAPETVEEEEWIKPLPLPTPEEKMRLQAQAIPADIIAINITGNGPYQLRKLLSTSQAHHEQPT